VFIIKLGGVLRFTLKDWDVQDWSLRSDDGARILIDLIWCDGDTQSGGNGVYYLCWISVHDTHEYILGQIGNLVFAVDFKSKPQPSLSTMSLSLTRLVYYASPVAVESGVALAYTAAMTQLRARV
jgi:hypothetical protein